MDQKDVIVLCIIDVCDEGRTSLSGPLNAYRGGVYIFDYTLSSKRPDEFFTLQQFSLWYTTPVTGYPSKTGINSYALPSTCRIRLGLEPPGCRLYYRSRVDLLVRQSAQGKVYLDRLPDRQFQASHPIRLDQALIARSLQGMIIREESGLLRTLTSSQKPTVPVFSETEIAFLAPGIAEGLKKAASDQQVGFRLMQASDGRYRERAGAAVGSSEPPLGNSSPETTSGRVFAYGRSLYIYLTEVPGSGEMIRTS